nr:unnamed protein product [Digitaria exilis]
MAAKPPHSHVVECPPTRRDGGQVDAPTTSPQERKPACCRRKLLTLSCIFVAAATMITGIVLLVVFLAREFPAGDPAFSVTVSGATGLDLDPARVVSSAPAPAPAPAPETKLSPVIINLTFHIDNSRNSEYRACVPDLSAATVSYGDAPLANGSVPAFCAGKKNESEPMAVTARGDADVAVPRALLDQLTGELAAGEATVDVKVTMPGYCVKSQCRDAVLTCKAKIGGGPSPCRMDYVHKEGESTGEEEDAPVIFFMPNPVSGMPPIFIWG